MKLLVKLSQAQKRRRFKKLAEVALQKYDIGKTNLKFVIDTSNVVFRVDTPTTPYVLRVNSESPTQRWQMMTKAELCWLAALRRDTDLAVPEPVTASDGEDVHVVATDAIPDGRIVTMLRWMEGELIGDEPTLDIVSQTGTFMAHLHRHADTFVFPEGITRAHTDWQEKLTYWHVQEDITSTSLSAEDIALCATASQKMLVDIAQIGTEQDYGLIHADLHFHNCLLHQGQVRVIDFADSRFTSYFYDMAVTLAEVYHYDNYDAFQTAFFDAYTQVRALPDHTLDAVQTFIVARAFDIIEWIHLDWTSLHQFPFGPAMKQTAMQRIRDYIS